MTTMAELTGDPGFAPIKKESATTGRRTATVEMIATLGLTVALAIAATAVSLGNRSLTRGELVPHGNAQSPAGLLLDQTTDWLSISARLSAKAQ
jgi:hypothetical protein